jgi:hypothetical protein
MAEDFKYDVFLSHSSKDKEVVRDVAERLKAGGLRVWFDEWEIKPGDSIPAKIEDGLETSRVLVLCMSANAFGSDWAKLESYTFRFRDPLNTERRFVPVRLDDAPIKGSLSQFRYVLWWPSTREQASSELLEACNSSAGQQSAGATPVSAPMDTLTQAVTKPVPSRTAVDHPNEESSWQEHTAHPLTKLEINKVVNRYIGVSSGYLGDFSYRTHHDFYLDLDLDIDPYDYEGTTRERFMAILSGSKAEVQARILEGVLDRFPVDSSELRTQDRYDEIASWIARLRT